MVVIEGQSVTDAPQNHRKRHRHKPESKRTQDVPQGGLVALGRNVQLAPAVTRTLGNRHCARSWQFVNQSLRLFGGDPQYRRCLELEVLRSILILFRFGAALDEA